MHMQWHTNFTCCHKDPVKYWMKIWCSGKVRPLWKFHSNTKNHPRDKPLINPLSITQLQWASWEHIQCLVNNAQSLDHLCSSQSALSQQPCCNKYTKSRLSACWPVSRVFSTHVTLDWPSLNQPIHNERDCLMKQIDSALESAQWTMFNVWINI